MSEPDEDGVFQFEINISNGQSSAKIEFWAYANNFVQFGSGLSDFPKTIQDKVTYELGGGKDGKRWAHYLLLEAFCYDSTGKSAIKVKIDNKFDIPTYESHEFFIKSEAASINRLGQSLKKWNPVESKVFEWTSNE